MQSYAPRIDAASRVPPAPVDQKTALLITYGDQVTTAGASPLRTLAEFLDAHAQGTVSGVHLLPFYPFTSDDGFSVTDYYAVDPRLGTWEDVARVGEHFDLMFDAVINHVSAQSAWFEGFRGDDPRYRDWFIVVEGDPDLSQVVRPRALPLLTAFETSAGEKRVWTTFSADQIDLNYRNPAVLLEILNVLLYYVERGARLLRLDAIAFLWKEIGTPSLHLPQTHAVIQLARAVMDAIAPHALLVTETNVPHADNISYFGDGANEAHWVYNFALPPLTMHALQTGDATPLTRWARTLKVPSPQTAFFNFLASHDGIGLNPARGILSTAEIDALVARTLERGGQVGYKHNTDGTTAPYELNINYLDALTVPGEPEEASAARFAAAHAMMFAPAGVPGIYFHSLFGSRGDPAGAAASGIPRRINRQKLGLEVLERELALAPRAQVFEKLSRLLRVRGTSAAFHPASAQEILEIDPRVFGVARTARDGSTRVVCLHNVSDEPVRARLPEPATKPRRDLLEGGYGGALAGTEVVLAPYGVAWLDG
jgi:sucrose phosphorylase